MMRREEVGSVLVYTVVTAALIAAVVAALGLAQVKSDEDLLAIFIGSSLIAITGLVRQARRDFDAALMYLGVFGLSTAIFAGVYILSTDHLGTDGGSQPTQALAAAATVVGIASLAWTFFRQRSSNPLYPDILATRYGGHEALEVTGVQFVHHLTRGRMDQPHRAIIVLQNCHAAERTVRIELDAEANAKYLRHPREVSVELGPAEVVRVAVPVVSPTYEGRYKLYFHPRVSGPVGPRVRLGRRKAAPRRVQPWETLVGIFFLHFTYGGGTYFEIPRLRSDLWQTPLPEVDRRHLWQPGSNAELRCHQAAEGSYSRER